MGSAHVQPHCQKRLRGAADCRVRHLQSIAVKRDTVLRTCQRDVNMGAEGSWGPPRDQLRGRPFEPRTTRDNAKVTIAASCSPDSIPRRRSRAAARPI